MRARPLNPQNRLLLVVMLGISAILWLGVSSVAANALHVLAKSNFSLRPFGSFSIWLATVGLAWPLIVGYVLTRVTPVGAISLMRGMCTVGLWVVGLAILTSIGDKFLGRLGSAAIIVWVLEIAVALLLVRATSRLALAEVKTHLVLWGAVASLAWLMEAKVLLLCLSPGVVVRL